MAAPIAAGGDLWTGELTLHRDGYGFLMPEDSRLPDVFIPERFLNGAWHMDRITVRVAPPDARGRREGKVVQILGHGLTRVVGHVERADRAWVLVPNDDRIRLNIRITSDAVRKLKQGDVVVVKIEQYANQPHSGVERGRSSGSANSASLRRASAKPGLDTALPGGGAMRAPVVTRGGPSGVVVQHLDERGSLATESEIVIAEHQLTPDFPKTVVQEAERRAREEIRGGKGRKDLRQVPLVTIDGETAKDFDDAVAAQQEKNGIRLWVAIADVSHYVRPGHALDDEAYVRGTSVYFPGFCLPMLPQALSEDVCSLRPNVDRYCMVCELLLTPKGEIRDPQFYRAVMRSHARLTYVQVQEFLDGSTKHLPELPDSVFASLKLLERAAKQLRRMRRERGSVDFDLPEPMIEIDIMTGDVGHIARAERYFAHFLIEELMIMANEAVARFLTNSKSGCVYRVHDLPSEERLEMLLELMRNLGLPAKLPRPPKPRDVGDLTKLVHGKPEERFVNHMLLRAMAKAVYDTRNIGHFGLASTNYCHFTSPIRRYPDLLIHRLLGNIIDRGNSRKPNPVLPQGRALPAAAMHCSRRERIAMEAEREMVKLYVASFMQQHIGEEFDGIISHCSKYGFYVELKEFFVEGIVPLAGLTGDRFTFDLNRHAIIGTRTKQIYQIGESIRVRVAGVDMLKRETQFERV